MAEENKKILIVDDERPLSQALTDALKKAGFVTKAAFDGQEALNILDMEKFDLILLDLLMPKMNGLDVLTQLKNRRYLTPIIVLSNLGDETEIKKAKELGAVDYFIKSDTPIADVLSHVQKILNQPPPPTSRSEYGKAV